MSLSKITKVIIAASSLLLSYRTSCSQADGKNSQKLAKFVQTKQYRSNNPIQDRICVSEMKRLKGLLISVFDGHGGDLCAEYVAGNMPQFFDQAFNRNKAKKFDMQTIVKLTLEQCYDDLQNGFKAIFQQNISDARYRGVGSCALTAVLTPTFVVVGNSGDCEGVFLGGAQIVKTNQRLNAGEKSEQKRLRQEFPEQKDIYECIRFTNYCYVKGRLQPTRSFGDFYLKNKQYNFTNLSTFTGPYITHKPKITTFNLNPELGKTLVIATDGLWDELTQHQMDVALKNYHGTQHTAEKLFEVAMDKILARNEIKSFQYLDKIINRRNLHDDISIITVDLKKFMEEYNNMFFNSRRSSFK